MTNAQYDPAALKELRKAWLVWSPEMEAELQRLIWADMTRNLSESEAVFLDELTLLRMEKVKEK